MSDSFGILVGVAGFVIGVGMGMSLATTRHTPLPKGKPVTDNRMRKLWVIDPLLERERQHPTLYPYPDERGSHAQK